MNAEYVQGLRYKLQKRVRRLNASEVNVFQSNLRNLLRYLHKYSIFIGLLEDLERRYPELPLLAEQISSERRSIVGETEDEHAALAYFVIARCGSSDDANLAARIARNYDQGQNQFSALNNVFYSIFVEPLYEYLDEHLDDQRAILALLRRYKHKCEWFQRQHVQTLLEKGERVLAEHLYEYLFDQGIDFVIEPSSASGEADLISLQSSDDPLVADVKIFDPAKSKNKAYILRGFRQVYTYTLDYNQPFGYLVVYNNSGRDLAFPASASEQSTPIFTHNNKTIFIITVDVFAYPTTASQRGRLDSVIITEEDLIRGIEEPA